MSNPTRATAIVLLLLASAPAGAFDFQFPWIDREASFEITETLILDYHDNNYDLDEQRQEYQNNDHYGDIRNRLNLKLSVDDFTFSARFDTVTFLDRPEGASPPYLDRYAPEKLAASCRGKSLQVDLGDFYASFGRAIALRIRKTDELSEDTTLLGAKVRAQLGPVEATGLAGLTNPTNTDGIEEKTLEDPFDLITGMRVSGRIADTLVLGIHGVGVFIDPLDQNQEARNQIETSDLYDSALVVGTSLDVPDLSDLVSLYAEFNWMEKSFKFEDLSASTGWAAYFGGNLYLDNWTVTAEFKWYDDYRLHTVTDRQNGDYKYMELDYIRPPTLEPEDMEVLNNEDVMGARLKVDWRPGGGDTLLFASYAGFLTKQRRSADDRWINWIYNLQVGAEQFFLRRGRAKVDVGLREEVPRWTAGIHRHLIYVNADVKVPLTTRHSLNFHGTNWLAHTRFGADASNFLKGDWTLGYSWSPLLSFDLILGYDTEQSMSRDLDVFIHIDGIPVRQVFLAGSVTVNISSRLVFKLLAGQMRGGPTCVGGACRILPSFAGVRLETVIRI